MEEYPIKLILLLGFVVAIVLFLLLRKFFFKLLTSILVTLTIVILGTGIYLYRMFPQGDPAIGKPVYLKKSGEYLGIVVASEQDTQLGEIFQVRTQQGQLTRLRRANVIVK
jgi:hypothetical protein